MSDPSSSTSISVPVPKRSLNRQAILEEDEYTAALSHIIARDFFPSLVHLDATNSYLDALETRDPQLVSASVRNLESVNATIRSTHSWQIPSETPYGVGPSDTPMHREPPAKRAHYDTDMSLDAFQARYTSEDNSSFTRILDEENARRREKYGWAWDAQKRVEAQKVKALEARERALIEMPQSMGVKEKMKIASAVPAGLITAHDEQSTVKKQDDAGDNGDDAESSADKRSAPQTKDRVDVVDVMAPKKDTRPAGVDGWAFRARNSLMFSPGVDVSPFDPSSSSNLPEKGPQRTIKHRNTRLPEQDEALSSSRALSEPPSPTQSHRPKSPGVNNFSYVPSLPSPTPSELGPVAVRQLMTWGTLAGTPRILSQSDDPAEASAPVPNTPFHISAPSKREALSHKLSSSAAMSLRAKANLLGQGQSRSRKGDMAPPLWTPRRAEASGALTPAAKRRAEAMGRMAGWENKKDKDLNRVRWTPTPSPVTRR
ncbi:nuclear protein DGCR14 [Multifurca ochricompacta]|uniref:Nuclear protein DGCR14 n=1 Tax=Multifurca ochricompacta TaxID=376703 RepID=A0AAD4MCD6_9AGAM|nr:nuclear protein DGCR14 [Multifurca ochricompacta]